MKKKPIVRILPVRREILLGILYCDLIGFHTYDYARHFLSSCTRILGLPTMPNGVEFAGRLARVGTFPIGIEPSSFTEVSSAPKKVSTCNSFSANASSFDTATPDGRPMTPTEPHQGVSSKEDSPARAEVRWRQAHRRC